MNDRLAPLLARTADALSERADGLDAHRRPATWAVFSRSAGAPITTGRSRIVAEGDLRVAVYEGADCDDLTVRPEHHRPALHLRARAWTCAAAAISLGWVPDLDGPL